MQTHLLAGSLWMIGYAFMSVANDTLTKFLATDMAPAQLVFLRFFFGGLSLLAVLLWQKRSITSKFFFIHSIRGLMLYFGMLFYTYSLQNLPLAVNIVGCFTIPIFVSVLAAIFLKEKLTDGIGYTLLSFTGVIIAFYQYLSHTTPTILFLGAAILLFAILDILNKKLLNSNEDTVLIMFYTAMMSAAFSFPGAYHDWEAISLSAFFGCVILGLGGNFVFYCLLKSFASAPIIYVQPFKYIELPMSFTAGIFLFNESLTTNIILGSIIICFTTLHGFYKNFKKTKTDNEAMSETISQE